MIKPLSDHVVLEALKEEKKKSAILLPDSSDKDRSEVGKVVAVGPGKLENGKRSAPEVKKGDVVFYRKYSEHKIKDGDKEFIVVKGEDIFGVK